MTTISIKIKTNTKRVEVVGSMAIYLNRVDSAPCLIYAACMVMTRRCWAEVSGATNVFSGHMSMILASFQAEGHSLWT